MENGGDVTKLGRGRKERFARRGGRDGDRRRRVEGGIEISILIVKLEDLGSHRVINQIAIFLLFRLAQLPLILGIPRAPLLVAIHGDGG